MGHYSHGSRGQLTRKIETLFHSTSLPEESSTVKANKIAVQEPLHNPRSLKLTKLFCRNDDMVQHFYPEQSARFSAGGASGAGTVFKLAADGTFSSLYSFSGGPDGSNCRAGLLLASDGNLYGVTEGGGVFGKGTIFRMSPDGRLATLAQFDGYEGANPEGTLIQGEDGQLYGTAREGGAGGKGRSSASASRALRKSPSSRSPRPLPLAISSISVSPRSAACPSLISGERTRRTSSIL